MQVSDSDLFDHCLTLECWSQVAASPMNQSQGKKTCIYSNANNLTLVGAFHSFCKDSVHL